MKKISNISTALTGINSGIQIRIAKTMLILTFIFISAIAMAQTKSAPSGKSAIAASENKLRELYRSYIAAANARDFGAIAKLIAPDIKLNGKPAKREDALAGFKALVNAVPDYTWHLEDLIVDGDHIGARLRDTGTPTVKTFFGENPNGRSVEFSEYGSYKVRNGQFVEMWYLIDLASANQQLKK